MVGLLVVSLLAAIGMLLVFKATSDQVRLAAVKRQIHACLFEMRLFNDDLAAVFRAQLEILKHNLSYMRLSLVPMVWMIVPLLLLIAQLQFHYGYRGFQPGQSVMLKVRLQPGSAVDLAGPQVSKAGGAEQGATGSGASGAAAAGSVSDVRTDSVALGGPLLARPAATLEVPPGLTVETPATWLPAIDELVWRLRAEQWGDYAVQVRVGSETYSKTLQVSRQVSRRSPERLAPTFLNQLLYPAEASLPDASPVLEIAVDYPEASVGLFGVTTHWLIVFFILSIVFAFALRNKFGVTI